MIKLHAASPNRLLGGIWISRELSEPTNLTVACELSTFRCDFAKPVKGTGDQGPRDEAPKFHGKILHADAVRAIRGSIQSGPGLGS
jgi:hypothetical protein